MDDWGFGNSVQILANGSRNEKGQYTYFLTEADRQKLFENLSNLDKERIEAILESASSGSCYGMAVTSILHTMGLFDVENHDSLSDIVYSKEEQPTLTDEIISRINYYQLMQYTQAITQRMYGFKYEDPDQFYLDKIQQKAEKEKLQMLVKEVEAGKPTLLLYSYQTRTGVVCGHAVVAYGIVDSQNGYTEIPISSTETYAFDKRILLYDSSCPIREDWIARDMYVNTETGTWLIKYSIRQEDYKSTCIMNTDAHNRGSIDLISNDVDLLNYQGKNSPEPKAIGGESDMYFAKWQREILKGSNGLPSEISFSAVQDDQQGGYHAANGTVFMVPFIDYCGTGSTEDNIDRKLVNGEYAWCYEGEMGAIPMSVSMEYEHYTMTAKIDEAKKLVVDPNGTMECRGMNGGYRMSIIAEQNYHPTKWYGVTVSGQSGEQLSVTADMERNGWLIENTRGALKKLDITVFNDGTTQTISVNVDENSALVTEDKNGNLVVMTDISHTGRYVTEVEPLNESGDVNGDGKVDADDANEVLIEFLTHSVMGEESTMSETAQALADVDHDGKITADDANGILMMYLKSFV